MRYPDRLQLPVSSVAVYAVGDEASRELSVGKKRAVRLANHLVGHSIKPKVFADSETKYARIKRHSRARLAWQTVLLHQRTGLIRALHYLIEAREAFRDSAAALVLADLETCFPEDDRPGILDCLHEKGIRVFDAAVAEELEKDVSSSLVKRTRSTAQLLAAVTLSRSGGNAGRPAFSTTEAGRSVLSRIRSLSIVRKPTTRRPSFATIAEKINNEGHKTASGKPWTKDNVRDFVLRYMPQFLSKRRRRTKKKRPP